MATTITGGSTTAPDYDATTIQSAVNTGGLILLTAGTYTIGATVQFFSGGTPKTDITLRGEPGTRIVPVSTFNGKLFDLGSGTAAASNIRFENLVFDMSALSSPLDTSYVIRGAENSGVAIVDCSILSAYSGAYLTDQTDLELSRNVIANTRAGALWGVFIGGANRAVVRGNEAYGNNLDGIKFGPPSTLGTGTASVTNGSAVVTGTGTSFTSDLVGKYIVLESGADTFSGTVLTRDSATQLHLDQPWAGPSLSGQYFIGTRADLVDALIEGNIAHDNAQDGINVDTSAAHNVLITGNIMHDNGGFGMHVKQVFEGSELRRVRVTSNIFSNNAGGGMNVQVNDVTPEPAGSVTVGTGGAAGQAVGSGFLTTMMPNRDIYLGATAMTVTSILDDTHMKVSGTLAADTLSYLPENRGMCIVGNQFELFLGNAGSTVNHAIRLQRIRECLVAGNRIIGITANTRGILIVDSEDLLVRDNVIATNDDCVVLAIQVSTQYNRRNVIERNVLTTRAGMGVHLTSVGTSGSNSMAHQVGNIIRHNEVRLLTGTGQWSIIEDFSGATTVRYQNSLGSVTTAPSTNGIQGDVYWNSAPSSGGRVGWICTVSGAPGTWKGFGAIV
jgi:hypothetical protein